MHQLTLLAPFHAITTPMADISVSQTHSKPTPTYVSQLDPTAIGMDFVLR